MPLKLDIGGAIIEQFYPRGADGWRRPSSGPLAGVPLMYDRPGAPTVPDPPARRAALDLSRVKLAWRPR